jgi:acetate kinase
MKILVINAGGSSSLKYQLMDPDTGVVYAKGLCERIGIDGRLTHKVLNEAEETVCKQSRDIPMPTHKEAIAAVLDILVDPTFGVVKSRQMRWTRSAIAYCTAAISLLKSCIVDEACKQAIDECIPLGPLHNPANLRGILACEKAMPGKKQVAVFDTAFHMTMPPEGLPLRHSYQYYTNDHHPPLRLPRHLAPLCLPSRCARAAWARNRRTSSSSSATSATVPLCLPSQGRQVSGHLHGPEPVGRRPMGTRCGDIDHLHCAIS